MSPSAAVPEDMLVADPGQGSRTDRNRQGQDSDQAGTETGGRIQNYRHPQAPRRVQSLTVSESVTRRSRTEDDRIR